MVKKFVSDPLNKIAESKIIDIQRIQSLINDTSLINVDASEDEIAAFIETFDNFDAETTSKRVALAVLKNKNNMDKDLLESFLMSDLSSNMDTLYSRTVEMKQTLANAPEAVDMSLFNSLKKDNPDIFKKILKTQDVQDNISIIVQEIDPDEAFSIISGIIDSIPTEGKDLDSAEIMATNPKSAMSIEQKQILQEMIDSKRTPIEEQHPVELALTGVQGVVISAQEMEQLKSFHDLLINNENTEISVEASIALLEAISGGRPNKKYSSLAGEEARKAGNGLPKLIRRISIDANKINRFKCN